MASSSRASSSQGDSTALYRSTYMEFASTTKGEIKVVVQDDPEKNPDDTLMGLYKCKYTVGLLTFNFMVKKETSDHPISPDQYAFLSSLNKYPGALAVENYYMNKMKIACLVVEPVRGTFQSWLVTNKNHHVNPITDDGRMGPRLRKIILDLCSLVTHVLKEKWYPEHISLDDLYLKVVGGEPTLAVLLSDVKKGSSKPTTDSTWNHVKEIIKYCYTFNNVILTGDSLSLCNFIGCHTRKITLEGYPDNWSNDDKLTYVRLIVQGEINKMKKLVKDSNVIWPKSGQGIVEPMLQDIINHDTVATYNINVPWDYIRLCRNVHKKFNVPGNVKAEIINVTGFLRKMEEWEPKIWTSLYETIGCLFD